MSNEGSTHRNDKGTGNTVADGVGNALGALTPALVYQPYLYLAYWIKLIGGNKHISHPEMDLPNSTSACHVSNKKHLCVTHVFYTFDFCFCLPAVCWSAERD